MTQLLLNLKNENLNGESLAQCAQELVELFMAETTINAELGVLDLDPTQKGEAINFTTIVLSFISSGSAVALFEVFKAYISKDSSMKIEISKSTGEKIIIDGTNLTQDQLNKLLSLADNVRAQ